MRLAIYTYHFRRYLGRNLTRAEAAVIGPLEKMRIHASAYAVTGKIIALQAITDSPISGYSRFLR